jgi:hypothetical protein
LPNQRKNQSLVRELRGGVLNAAEKKDIFGDLGFAEFVLEKWQIRA